MACRIEVLANDGNLCGEAPTWDGRSGRLLWVDNESSLVYELETTGGAKRILSRNLMVGGIAINRRPGYIFAGFTGIHLWRGQDDYRTIAAEYAGEPLKFNDIIADPQGRVYGGTLYWGDNGMEKHGRLYLFSPDGSAHVVDEGIECSNGLGFSPDNRTLYYADSTARRIYAYDVDTNGTLSRKQTFVRVSGAEGIPDGLTVDRDGFVWCAHWYGGEVVRYDPDGEVERRIAMPAKQVSSVMFGGKDLTDLYVTSAASSWRGPYAPPGYDFDAPNIGGALYRIRLDIQGKSEHLADFN